MKRNVFILDICALGLTVLIIATICLCMASSSFLVAGERIIVDGKVSANKDKNSNVIAVSVITNSGEIFKITLDKNGKKLAEEMDGKWVEVIADVSRIGDDIWLEVIRFNEVKEDFVFRSFTERS